MVPNSALLKQIAPHCSPVYLAGIDAAHQALEDFDVTTPLRQAHFLGQFLGETGGGHVLQESGAYTTVDRLLQIFGVGNHTAAITRAEATSIIATPMPEREKRIFERVYGAGNPRKMKELGNRAGDGWPFRGTGPVQSTGRGAAERWAKILNITMKDDQQWMLDPKVVFMPSLLEWRTGALNILADRNNGKQIRRVINGGYNGLAECQAWTEKAWAALRRQTSDPAELWLAGSESKETADLQEHLNALGYAPALVVDGRGGPATKAAVVWFQKIAGLNPDGVAGPVTTSALNLRIAATRGGHTAAAA